MEVGFGLSPEEQEAIARSAGRRIVSVEHNAWREGEALLIVFEGGDALAVESVEQLRLTHMPPLARQAVQRQWSEPLMAPEEDGPAVTVGRRGTTFSMTREPVTGWRRVLGPMYRLVLAWRSRRGV